jgi:ADP-heptose:LPS heptosyltransferase
MNKILVIRHGALGDVVLSFPAFAAIRAAHPQARIAVQTTQPFSGLLRQAPWFDDVLIDPRPAWWNVAALAAARRQLRGHDFVYDLQTSGRSTRYFRLAGRPPWSGIARGCSHPHDNPLRTVMHTLERQREQLEMAGISRFPPPDLSWLGAARQAPSTPYALLVPGAAPHRPEKRWPAEHFGQIARRLLARGLTPVVIGTAAEAPLAAIIRETCPQAVDLTARTDIADIYGLARGAALCVGNDTGPMHLAAASGAACIVLFSAASDPALTAPRGPGGSWPRLFRVADLSTLEVERVAEALP